MQVIVFLFQICTFKAMKFLGQYVIIGALSISILAGCTTKKAEEKSKQQTKKEDYTPEFNEVEKSFIKEKKSFSFSNELKKSAVYLIKEMTAIC